MIEDLLVRRDALEDELETTTGIAENQRIGAQLNRLNAALGIEEEVTPDDLWDEWERDLDEGRMPDLDK